MLMSDRDAFERILASLYDAMLDETHWPATSALIDEACGLTGNGLLVGEGRKDDIRVQFIGLYARGQRRPDLEREYLEVYHPIDERVPRFRQLPESRLVSVKALYTAEELKTSPAYNEAFLKSHYQEGLNVRLKGLEGSHMCWALGDPVGSEGWGTSQIALVRRLLPHIRHFVRVRQALVRAQGWTRPWPPCWRPVGSASCTWIGGGGSWPPMTGPVTCCDRAMEWLTGLGCCARARRRTSPGWTGWWPPRYPVPGPWPSAGRCRSAAHSCCRR